ncbi:MAG: hypothetical protein EU531_10930 [Promethearchaeota archaeon]|nr:MAG: hypothetical protein EU531_10930 [Candidatus Lokiarchaeota archaeon]
MGRKKQKKQEKKPPMKNITINIPTNYDKNIQWLISKGLVASRSQAIRLALGEFLEQEYSKNLRLLRFERINGVVEPTHQSKPKSTTK